VLIIHSGVTFASLVHAGNDKRPSDQQQKHVITDEYFNKVTHALVMHLRQVEESALHEGNHYSTLLSYSLMCSCRKVIHKEILLSDISRTPQFGPNLFKHVLWLLNSDLKYGFGRDCGFGRDREKSLKYGNRVPYRGENAVRSTPKPFQCGRFVADRPHFKSLLLNNIR